MKTVMWIEILAQSQSLLTLFSYLPLVRPEKKMDILVENNFRFFGTIFLPSVAVIGQPPSTMLYTHLLSQCHFSNHLKHSVTMKIKGSKFLQTLRTFNQHIVQKPKARPSVYQQLW
jgi:hypothetical protein